MKDNSNNISNTNNVDKITKTDTLSQDNQVKGNSLKIKKKAELEVCDNEEDIDEEETVKKMVSEVVETIKEILGISD